WSTASKARGKRRRVASRLSRRVDERASSQFFEWKLRVDPAGMVQVTVDQPVEQVTNVEAPGPSRRVRVANDVNRAAIAQQMIELRPIGKLIDPLKGDQHTAEHGGARWSHE